ncbi:MAG: hypothetical protein GWP05_03560 [Anaerolineaceae bacterium]|nr:hypothetical protein [Anaerolineaceae bacterium]
MSGAYPARLDPLELRRTLVVTKRWLLLVDDMTAGQGRRLTWICHSDGEFTSDGAGATAKVGNAALHVVPLSGPATEVKMQKTIVMAGTGPGRGKATQRGFQINQQVARQAGAAGESAGAIGRRRESAEGHFEPGRAEGRADLPGVDLG